MLLQRKIRFFWPTCGINAAVCPGLVSPIHACHLLYLKWKGHVAYVFIIYRAYWFVLPILYINFDW
jgi:hypothetical protein